MNKRESRNVSNGKTNGRLQGKSKERERGKGCQAKCLNSVIFHLLSPHDAALLNCVDIAMSVNKSL